jgi:hypothetical protein
MARKNAVVSATVSDDLNVLTITVEGFDPIAVDRRNLDPEIRARAEIHGLGQKIGDAAALGKDATPKDKYEAMRSVADRLLEGDWNKRNGEGGGTQPGIIFRAFSEYVADKAKKAKKPVPSADAIKATYGNLDRKGQLALRTVPEIATIMDRMKSETASKGVAVDTESLLAELGV